MKRKNSKYESISGVANDVIYKPLKSDKNYFTVSGVVEKPNVKNAPSNKAVIGRYILPRKIFKKNKIS